MMDSMYQSWLPRVVAAAFPSDGAKDPPALLQRRQLEAVTAARYLAPSSALGGVPKHRGPSTWSGLPRRLTRPRLLSQRLPLFQHLLSPDATAKAALLSHPDPEP